MNGYCHDEVEAPIKYLKFGQKGYIKRTKGFETKYERLEKLREEY